MEVYAAGCEMFNSLHSENEGVHTKAKQMKELKVNLKEATNYLIQLFFKTNQKFSCTRTKVGKLLSIVAFKYAFQDTRIFDEIIYRYPPNCGTLIKDLMLFIPRDVYIRDVSLGDNDSCNIISEGFSCCIDIPAQYKDVGTIPGEVKDEIEKVFKLFGAYPASDLGSLLNPIVEQVVVEPSDKIELEKLKNISVDVEDNPIIKYLCEQ